MLLRYVANIPKAVASTTATDTATATATAIANATAAGDGVFRSPPLPKLPRRNLLLVPV